MNKHCMWLVICVLLAGCGGGGSGLESACRRACAAMYRTPCQNLDASLCQAGCPYLADQMPFCQEESAVMYNCAATLQYECTENGPMPTSIGCVEESLTFSECIQDGPCRGHCQALIDADCGYSNMETCLDDCASELVQADRCEWELEDLYECHGLYGVTCEAGTWVSKSDCDWEQEDYDDCVNR